jgi:hypothetical protein
MNPPNDDEQTRRRHASRSGRLTHQEGPDQHLSCFVREPTSQEVPVAMGQLARVPVYQGNISPTHAAFENVQHQDASQDVQLQPARPNIESRHIPQDTEPQNTPQCYVLQHTCPNVQLQHIPGNVNLLQIYQNIQQHYNYFNFHTGTHPAGTFQPAFPRYPFLPDPIAWSVVPLTTPRFSMVFQPPPRFRHDSLYNRELLNASLNQREFSSAVVGQRQQAGNSADEEQTTGSEGVRRKDLEKSILKVQEWLLSSFPEDVGSSRNVCEEEDVRSLSPRQTGQQTKELQEVTETSKPIEKKRSNVRKTPSLGSSKETLTTESQGAKPKHGTAQRPEPVQENLCGQEGRQESEAPELFLQSADDRNDVMCPFGCLPVQACNWSGPRNVRRGHVVRYHYWDVEHGNRISLAANIARVLIAYDEMFLCYTFIHPGTYIVYCVAQYASMSNKCFYYRCEICDSDDTYVTKRQVVTSVDEVTFSTLLASRRVATFDTRFFREFWDFNMTVCFIIVPEEEQ